MTMRICFSDYGSVMKFAGDDIMEKQLAALATDEENIVMWDIDSLLSDCAERPYVTIDTKRLIPKNWLCIDREYAMTTDVTKPIVLFEVLGGNLFVADGNHRLYRAAAEHIQKMHVVLIPQEIHLSYLYRCTADDYCKVIEGLQDEGIFINNFMKN